MQNLEVLLQKLNSCTVDVPELKLLRQYHSDAVLWISRFNEVLVNISEREDQHNVVDELNCILKDGASLRIQGSFIGICKFSVSLLLEIVIIVIILFIVYYYSSMFVFWTVDELPLVGVELKKACCREKALKVIRCCGSVWQIEYYYMYWSHKPLSSGSSSPSLLFMNLMVSNFMITKWIFYTTWVCW